MILWLAVLAALAQDGSSFAERVYADATRLEQQGDLAAAALRYREILRLEPTWEHVRLDLGRVLEARGDVAGAEEVYAEGVGERSLAELARLLVAQERTSEAVEVLRRRADLLPASPEALVPYAAAQVADGQAREARETLRLYLERPGIAVEEDGAVPVATAIADALLARGEVSDAEELLRAIQAVAPAGSTQGVEELLVRIEVEEAAGALAHAGEIPLDARAIEELRTARRDLQAGRVAEARRRLEVLAIEHPRGPEIWATLAVAREAQADITGAEHALQVALAIDPLDSELHARLGDLLVDGYGGRRDLDAVRAYRKAVLYGAHDAELWWRKASAERSAGLWEQAVESATRALALEPDAPFARHARALVDGGARSGETPPVVLPPLALEEGVPREARLALARAQAWRERPESYALDRALAEARRARELAPDAAAPLHLEAEILAERGEVAAGVALFEEILVRDPDRADVLVDLAPLYERLGRTDDAEAAWERASAMDHPSALWRRARAEADAGRPWAARATLRRYFAATAGGAEYDAAQRLDAAMRARIRGAYVAGGAVTAGLVVIPIAWTLRRRAGTGLDGLLKASPSAWRDLARILSAIRHEILRHHASSFAEVADALERGDSDSGRWLAAQWFDDGGALARFEQYVAELRDLGRKAGVWLRLDRDATLGPLLAAMRRFAALRGALERGAPSRHVAAELRSLSAAIDAHVSPALGDLVSRLCLLEVNEGLFEDVIDSVWREPALRGEGGWRPIVSPLPPGPLLVRMFRADLGDVLANLLRNAVEATRGLAGPRVGIAVRLDEDPITGLERIEIRVRDSSPRRLSTATVRGRFVGRGLGLAVDLTTRAGGSIAVEDEPGWGKAVVVRLPRAEEVVP